ncbi:MAG: ABC transporter ATP-binding protein [Candidatus Rokuibacteriota bacterium]
MLEVSDLQVAYEGYQVLWGVDLRVGEREIVCLLGPNGAGKSTLMNSITGLVRPRAGRNTYRGERIDGLPTHRIVARGIGHVLERRRIFPYLTVYENLVIGSYLPHARRERADTLEWVLDLFPALREKLRALGHTLSGGQQQQLAVARGLMSRPALLMLDEPLLGLSPVVIEEIIGILRRIRELGVTVLFIEQNVEQALGVADRGYILESGRVALSGTAAALLVDPRVAEVYLGIARS